MEAQKRLELSTRVTPEIVVESVSFEGGYVTYYRVHGKRVGTLEYYDDELAAREGAPALGAPGLEGEPLQAFTVR